MSENIEIITPDGRYEIPAADLAGYRVGDAPTAVEDDEVEGFRSRPKQNITQSRIEPQGYISLKLGRAPVIRTNSYVLFSGETMEGSPF